MLVEVYRVRQFDSRNSGNVVVTKPENECARIEASSINFDNLPYLEGLNQLSANLLTLDWLLQFALLLEHLNTS